MASPRNTDREALATTREVAEHLGRSEKTLRNWRSRSEGPAYTGSGRGVRYRWRDVEDWLRKQTIRPAA